MDVIEVDTWKALKHKECYIFLMAEEFDTDYDLVLDTLRQLGLEE